MGDPDEGLLHLGGVSELVGDGLGDALGVELEGDLGDDGQPGGGCAQGLDEVESAHVVSDVVESGDQESAVGVDGADVVDAVLDGSVLEGSDPGILGVDPVLDCGALPGGDDSQSVSLVVDRLHQSAELAAGLDLDGHVRLVDVDDVCHLGHVDQEGALGVAALPGQGVHGDPVGHGAGDDLAELLVVGGLGDDVSVSVLDLGGPDEGRDVLDLLWGNRFHAVDALHLR